MNFSLTSLITLIYYLFIFHFIFVLNLFIHEYMTSSVQVQHKYGMILHDTVFNIDLARKIVRWFVRSFLHPSVLSLVRRSSFRPSFRSFVVRLFVRSFIICLRRTNTFPIAKHLTKAFPYFRVGDRINTWI